MDSRERTCRALRLVGVPAAPERPLGPARGCRHRERAHSARHAWTCLELSLLQATQLQRRPLLKSLCVLTSVSWQCTRALLVTSNMYHVDDGCLVRVAHLLGRWQALGLPGCPAVPAAGSASPAAEGARPAASAGGPPDAKLGTACMPCTPVTTARHEISSAFPQRKLLK